MILRVVLLILLQALPGLFSGNPKQAGRSGNALYEDEEFVEAADAYYRGLEAYAEREPDAIFYALQNNLGAALHRQQEFGMAEEAFASALQHAATETDVARSAYNAGNNAFLGQQAEEALAFYKQALLADPSNEDAKFNYEFVKRQMEQQEQQQSGDGENDEQEQQDQQGEQQDQEGEQEQEQQEQQEQQDGDNQQDQQQDQQEQQQEQQQQPQPQESEQLSRQQAERILQALENEEEQLLREVQKMKGRPRRVEKDW